MEKLEILTALPEVSERLLGALAKAPAWEDKELAAFNAQFGEIEKYYVANATNVAARGGISLNLFEENRAMVDLFVRHNMRGATAGDHIGGILDMDPEGKGESMIRPLTVDTFANATYTFTPGAVGTYNWIPNVAGTETATEGEQAWLILGYMETLSGQLVPYDYVQENVNDGIGVRRQVYLRQQMMAAGNPMRIVQRTRGVLFVETGNTLDLQLNIITANIQSGLWPIGVELISADAAEFAGVLG